jgi:hypothetical protein
MNFLIKMNDPLKDAATPGVEQIAAIEKKDAVARSYPPPPVPPEKATRMNHLYLAASLVLALILGVLLAPSLSAKATWEREQDVRSVYVVVKDPSPALQHKLAEMASSGVDVRVVSGRAGIQIPGAKLGVVAPEKIVQECVMVNGSSVYPLAPSRN